MMRFVPFWAAILFLTVVNVGVWLTGPAYSQGGPAPNGRGLVTMPRIHEERLLPGQVVAFRQSGPKVPRAELWKVTTDGVDPRGKVQIFEGAGDLCEVGTRIRLVLDAWDHFESDDNPVPVSQGAGLCARLIGGDGVTGVYVVWTERVRWSEVFKRSVPPQSQPEHF